MSLSLAGRLGRVCVTVKPLKVKGIFFFLPNPNRRRKVGFYLLLFSERAAAFNNVRV